MTCLVTGLVTEREEDGDMKGDCERQVWIQEGKMTGREDVDTKDDEKWKLVKGKVTGKEAESDRNGRKSEKKERRVREKVRIFEEKK